MQFLEPTVQLVNEKDNFKRIEAASRICYKSESKITNDSAYPFFQRMCKSGHTSTLEHSVIFVRTHNPETYLWLVNILNAYTSDTGRPHYIRFSKWDDNNNFYTPNDKVTGVPLGFCMGDEYLFSGNIRAWRNLCGRYKGEEILYSVFYNHPAFIDVFKDALPHDDLEFSNKDIEIVDSIPTDPNEYKYADMHNIVTLKIIGDRGVIDEFARHRQFGISVESTRYCVAGDMQLTTSNAHHKLTLSGLYNNKCNSSNGSWKRIKIRQYNEDTGELQFAKIKDIVFNGEKECIRISTKLGYEIVCTRDHLILTNNGYVEAGAVSVGDKLYVNGTELLYKNREWLYHQNITLNKTFVQISNEYGFNLSTLKKWARKLNIPKKGTGYFNVGRSPWNKGVQDQRQINALKQFHHNGLNDNRKIIKEDTKVYRKYNKGFCEVCGSNDMLHVHHIDQNRENNSPDNLITLCQPCHLRVHSRNLEVAYQDEIKSIEEVGIKPVYDIEMDSNYHNFVANGVVVHNCNYSNNGVTFCFPFWFNKIHDDPSYSSIGGLFGNICYDAEKAYMDMIDKIKIPQIARGALPLWVKSEIAMTGTVNMWKDFIALRDSAGAHPEAQKITKMIENVLVNEAGVQDYWRVKYNV